MFSGTGNLSFYRRLARRGLPAIARLIAIAIQTGWYVTPYFILELMRSAPLVVGRRTKRFEPAFDILDSHIPHPHVLRILCQHLVAFDHRNQKTRSLFRNQVTADSAMRLPPPQSHGNSFLPGTEYPL